MIRNLRDIGGMTGANGRKIKKGFFFRSAVLDKLDDEDIKWIRDNNINLVLDLRTPTEERLRPDIKVEGVTDINYYLQDENARKGLTVKGLRALILSAQTEEERLALVPDMKQLYAEMITNDFSRKRFAEVIKTIVNHKDGAVLIHCTSGKDRTGMTAALICTILGVSREDIFDDYLRSLEHAEWESAIMRESFIDEGASEALADKLKSFFALDREYLETFFKAMEDNYGTTDNYIKEVIGLSDSDIEEFRNRVLENE
ncbi:MAG: tyrosine-protein phosphatase [Bacillota bacterium]|nr:tyrosine-protein phosphatase [Bacillota bacterium]